MTGRRRRIQRIAEIREQELEERARQLASAHRTEDAASQRLASETERMRAAEDRRAQLATAATTTDAWREHNEWLELRELHQRAASARLEHARLAVLRARDDVMAARAALHRLEVLDERLERLERKVEERQELKAHDELSSQRVSARSRTR